MTVSELICHLGQLPPDTRLGLFPQTGGGVLLMTLRTDTYGEDESDVLIWDDQG